MAAAMAFVDEKKSETEGMEMTEDKAEKIHKSIEIEAGKIEKLSNIVREATESKKVTCEILLETFKTCVECEQSQKGNVLDELMNLVPNSIEAYKGFNKLLKNDNNLSKYPDRVKGAQKVYSTYWSLLIKTGPMLANLSSKVSTVINSIKSYIDDKKEYKDEDTEDYREIIIANIATCIDSLTEWQKASNKINVFTAEWSDLATLARSEAVEWQAITIKNKEQMKEDFNLWKRFKEGISKIRDFSQRFIEDITPSRVLSTLIGLPLLATTAPFGLAYGLYKSFCHYKASKDSLDVAKKTANNILYLTKVMNKIGEDSEEISNALAKLAESMSLEENDKDLTSLTLSVKSDLKTMKKVKSVKFFEKKLVVVDGSLQNIQLSMESFQKTCKKCVSLIQKSRDGIIKLQKKKLKAINIF